MVLIIFCAPNIAFCEENTDAEIENIISGFDSSDIENFAKDMDMDFDKTVYEFSTGNFSELSPGEFIKKIFFMLGDDISGTLPIYVQIIALCVLLGIITNLNLEGKTGAAKTAGMAGYIVIAAIIVSVCANIITFAKDNVGAVSTLTSYICPIMITLLTTLGGFSSINVLQPAIAAFTGSVISLINYIVFPCITLYFALAIINSISSKIKLDEMCKLVDGAVKFVLGFIFVIFIAMISLQSTGAATYDGLSLRTAKFAIDQSVPIIGGMFSESMDTVILCSSLVKNAVGTTGLVIILLTVLSPTLTIAINIIFLKISGIFASAFSDEKTTGIFSAIENGCKLLLATVLTSGIMAFILISTAVYAGNMNISLR